MVWIVQKHVCQFNILISHVKKVLLRLKVTKTFLSTVVELIIKLQVSLTNSMATEICLFCGKVCQERGINSVIFRKIEVKLQFIKLVGHNEIEVN